MTVTMVGKQTRPCYWHQRSVPIGPDQGVIVPDNPNLGLHFSRYDRAGNTRERRHDGNSICSAYMIMASNCNQFLHRV